jgi:hypothetical protein
MSISLSLSRVESKLVVLYILMALLDSFLYKEPSNRVVVSVLDYAVYGLIQHGSFISSKSLKVFETFLGSQVLACCLRW